MRKIALFLFFNLLILNLLFSQEHSEFMKDLQDEFVRAKAIHFSVSQQECIPLFNKIIEDAGLIFDKASEEDLQVLEAMVLDSHMFIGITYYNTGQLDSANAEFKMIVVKNPDYNPDASIISSTIINAFEKIRKENTAAVNITTNPEGAKIFIDTRLIGESPLKNKRINYGNYELRINKPNYGEIVRNIDVNKDVNIKEDLERTAASLEVRTCPPDVDVYLNDKFVGSTDSESYKPGNRSIYSGTDIISDPLIINEIPIGQVTVTFSSACYRTETREVYIESIDDYKIDEIFMLSQTGSIELIGDLSGARVYIDDQPYNMQMNLIENICYGDHIIRVVDIKGGIWTKKVKIDSSRRKFEEVVFKPTILWLGLYDRNGQSFESPNIEEFNKLLDRMQSYNIFFDDLRNDVRYAELYSLVMNGGSSEELREVLQSLHSKYNFDVIAFGILDPLSIDREFDVHFYHFSHHKPSVMRLATKETAFLYNFIINMDKDIVFTENWVGMELISNPSENNGLIVVKVYPGSPANSIGIENYDLIMSVDGNEINSAEEFREYLSTISIDDKIVLQISRLKGTVDMEIPVSVIPREYGYSRDLNYNLILAKIFFSLNKEKRPFFRDVYYLNMGLCYMHFGLYEKALKEGFSMISNYSNLGIMYGSPELYSGICSYNLGSIDRARALLSSAVLKEDSIFGDFPYYSVKNISNFYLFLIGAIQ